MKVELKFKDVNLVAENLLDQEILEVLKKRYILSSSYYSPTMEHGPIQVSLCVRQVCECGHPKHEDRK